MSTQLRAKEGLGRAALNNPLSQSVELVAEFER